MGRTGVYTTQKKDGSTYYRASITYKGKHISLGSYRTEPEAAAAYQEAEDILRAGRYQIDDYSLPHNLPLDKFVILINFRDHSIYFKTPIYLKPHHFEYYLSAEDVLIFDRDDLFFYASHKIMTRGGRLFYCDYGNQYGILSRYGLKSYAVAGRDYRFANGDSHDYRYANLQTINTYTGVQQVVLDGRTKYQVRIHVHGNYQVGTYDSEETAAIAYNKAADILNGNGISRHYIKNYISGISKEEYLCQYEKVQISPKLYHVTSNP